MEPWFISGTLPFTFVFIPTRPWKIVFSVVMQLQSQSFCAWNRFVLCCPNFLNTHRENLIVTHKQQLFILFAVFMSFMVLGKEGLWQQVCSFLGAHLKAALKGVFTGAPIHMVTLIHQQPSSILCSLLGSVSRVVSHGTITCSSDAQSTKLWSIKNLMVSLGYTTMATSVLSPFFPPVF